MGLKWPYRRQRVTQMADFDFLTALDSRYISTGNDVISYFQSTANRISVSIFGQVRIVISRYWFNQFLKKFAVLKTVIQGLHFLLLTYSTFFAD